MTTVSGHRKSEQYGGTGGKPFQDDLTEAKDLIAIAIRHGNRIDSILGVWKTENGEQITGKHHGGYGGSESIVVLQPGEKINKVIVHYGDSVDYLEFHTNQRNKFQFGGAGGEEPHAEVSGNILGFFGRSGDELDAIGFFLE